MTTVLSARNLVKDYAGGARRVLNGVSLDVEKGHFVVVMGPSGSGKSTLLHLLGGLDTPTAGEVLLDGHALSAMSDKERTLVRRRRFGFVFQAFNLVPVLTVAENIALPSVIAGHRGTEERLDRALAVVGLSSQRDQMPAELSGGEQQRVAIGRALFVEPAVLLADEPTGNLDSRTGTAILDLIKSAQRELGQTIVVVTHDPHVAAYGDAVVFLRDGALSHRLDLEGHSGDRSGPVLAWLQAIDNP